MKKDNILVFSIHDLGEMRQMFTELAIENETVAGVIIELVNDIYIKKENWIKETIQNLPIVTVVIVPFDTLLEQWKNVSDFRFLNGEISLSEAISKLNSMVYGKEITHIHRLKEYFNKFKLKDSLTREQLSQCESECFCRLVHERNENGHGI